MRKWFSSLFLLLISCSTLADSSVKVALSSAAPISNQTDISMTFLSEVFGTVGNSLNGLTGQMMGHLFYKLNQGIIIVAGVWLVYSVATIALRIANDGAAAAMGNNRNVAITLLKIVLGIALLIPNPVTGYSLMQDIVMKVVISGVGLADDTWSYGLQYVNDGGTVWHPPEDAGFEGNKIITAEAFTTLYGSTPIPKNMQNMTLDSQSLKLGKQIFSSEVCMLSSADHSGSYGKQASNANGSAIGPSTHTYYSYYIDDENNRINFPGYKDSRPFDSHSLGCGSVAWDVPSSTTTGDKEDAANQYKKLAVLGMVQQLLPAAKKYYCNQHADSKSCYGENTYDTIANDLAPYFFGAGLSYYNGILPVANMSSSQANSDELKKHFIKTAQAEGWITAGRYYWDLSQVQAQYNKLANLATYVPKTAISPDAPDDSNVGKDYSSAQAVVPSIEKRIYDPATQEGLLANYTGAASSHYTNESPESSLAAAKKACGGQIPKNWEFLASSKCTEAVKHYEDVEKKSHPAGGVDPWDFAKKYGVSIGTGALNTIGSLFSGKIDGGAFVKAIWSSMINTYTGLLQHLFGLFDLKANYDPIMFLHEIGMACIHVAGNIWLGIGIGAAMIIGIIPKCFGWVGGAAAAAMSWIQPIFMAIAAGLWIAGFMLAFFVPMYPYLIFTIGVIGWIISVIESMVAAPLVCLGLTHPEGHDFLGEAKQAVMLLLGVFLQPVLMVIGLIAGMILSYVSLRIVLFTFTGFVADLFQSPKEMSGQMVNSVLGAANKMMSHQVVNIPLIDHDQFVTLLAAPLVLIVFTALVYVVVTNSFNLIFLLRDNALRWIGVPQSGLPSPAESVRMVQSAANQGAQRSGEGFGQGANNAYRDMTNIGKEGPGSGKEDAGGGGAEETAAKTEGA